MTLKPRMSTAPKKIAASEKAARPSLRDHNKAVRRDNIVKAATRLFGRGSYDAVQMDDVAKAAAIGKPALYRYFPSKEELFLEVSDVAMRELEQALADVAKVDRPAREALAHMIELLVDALRSHFAALRLLSGEHPVLAGRWRQLFRDRRKSINSCIAGILRRGAVAGEFRPMNPDLVPAMIIGMIRGAVMDAPDTPPDRLVEAAITLILSGVQVGQGTAGGRLRRG
jgi:AcrR family transcriptional regulator